MSSRNSIGNDDTNLRQQDQHIVVPKHVKTNPRHKGNNFTDRKNSNQNFTDRKNGNQSQQRERGNKYLKGMFLVDKSDEVHVDMETEFVMNNDGTIYNPIRKWDTNNHHANLIRFIRTCIRLNAYSGSGTTDRVLAKSPEINIFEKPRSDKFDKVSALIRLGLANTVNGTPVISKYGKKVFELSTQLRD